MMTLTKRNRIINCLILSAFLLATALVLMFCLPQSAAFASADSGLFASGYERSVTKTYDGNSVTLDLQGSADGVEYAWYKTDGDAETFVCEGSAIDFTYPGESGSYFCRATDDGGVTYSDSDTIVVNISKAIVRAQIDDKETTYGDSAAALTYSLSTTLVSGDKEEDLGIVLNKAPGTNAGSYVISGTGDSDKYIISFDNGVYKINKRKIYVTVASLDSVYGEPILPLMCEAEPDSVFAKGEDISALNIVLTRQNGTDAGRYSITADYSNDNYDVVFSSATYTINPKTVSFYISGADKLVYNGLSPVLTCQLLGDGAELSIGYKIIYDRAVKSAGTYTAQVRLDDANYCLADDGRFSFTIRRAPLTINLGNIAYSDPTGISLYDSATYDGFVAGEDKETIADFLKEASLPTEPGSYSYPGGIADVSSDECNYELNYLPYTVTVYRLSLTSEKVTLTGSFMPDAELTVTEKSTDDINGYDRIDRLVAFAIDIDAKDGAVDKYVASVETEKSFFPLFLRACIIDEEGNKYTLDSFYVKDGCVNFTAEGDGTLVVYYDLLLPAIILAAIVLLIIIIAIKRGRDRRRYKRAEAVRTAAKAYADVAKYYVEQSYRDN